MKALGILNNIFRCLLKLKLLNCDKHKENVIEKKKENVFP